MSCDIIDSNLLDDLYDYSFSKEQGKTYINYRSDSVELQNTKHLVQINTPSLLKYVDFDYDLPDGYHIWLPIIVDSNNTSTISKKIGRNFTSIVPHLGIEEFVKFYPMFKNWKMSTKDQNFFNIDWFLNSDDMAYSPAYGIMGWMKIVQHGTFKDYNNLPPGMVYECAEEFIYEGKDGKKYEFHKNEEFIDYDDRYVISLYGFNDNTRFIPKSALKDKTINKKGISINNGKRVHIYISDGDFYSYYKYYGGTSSSYISSTLNQEYQHYYEIIHRTIKGSTRYPTALPAFWHSNIKKLASVLATHPLRTQITQEILETDDIFPSIYGFVNTVFVNANHEINAIKFINNTIFQYNNFRNINIPETFTKDYETGFITNEFDLIKCLMNKYQGYLAIKTSAEALTYKHQVLPHMQINQVVTDHVNRNVSKNVLYNNMSFEFRLPGDAGSHSFTTELSNTKSNYLIKTTGGVDPPVTVDKIPLYDNAKDFGLYSLDTNIGVTAGPTVYLPAYVNADYDHAAVDGRLDCFDNFPLIEEITCGTDTGCCRLKTNNVIFPSYKIEEEYFAQLLSGTGLYPFYRVESAKFSWSVVVGKPDNVGIKNGSTATPEFEFMGFGYYVIQLRVSIGDLYAVSSFGVYIVNYSPYRIGVDLDNKPAFKTITTQTIDGQAVEIITDDAVGYVYPNGGYTSNLYAGGDSPITIRFPQNRAGEFVPVFRFFNNVSVIYVDNNIAKTAGITELLFSRYGCVRPVKTNSYICVQTNAVVASEDEQFVPPNYVAKLDNATRFNRFYYPPVQAVSEGLCTFSIVYTPGTAGFKLYRIILRHLRDRDKPNCSSIYSNDLYQTIKPKLLAGENETVYERDIPTFSNTFLEFSFNGIGKGGQALAKPVELRPMPEISTYGSPWIYPMGGISTPNIHTSYFSPNNVPRLFYNTASSDPRIADTVVQGHNKNTQDSSKNICLLRDATILSNPNPFFGYGPENPNIKFQKGTFHPGLGFVLDVTPEEQQENNLPPNLWRNKTSSLKFNPGNKKSFVFTGPGFFEMSPGTHVSTISLSNDAWEVDTYTVKDSPVAIEILVDNTDPDEFDIHHGYRRLSGEFGQVERDNIHYDEHGGSYGAYIMKMRGRRVNHISGLLPKLDENGSKVLDDQGNEILEERERLQGSDLLFATIKNMEVKLNFLNQVNLKNAKIWLTITPCEWVQEQVKPEEDAMDNPDKADKPKFKTDPFFRLTDTSNHPIIANLYDSSLKYGKTNLTSQNKNLQSLISYLDQQNVATPGSHQLFLLNREHVEANGMDTVLYFSDRFSKYLSPRNMSSRYGIAKNQNPNTTNYILLGPTLCTTPEEYDKTSTLVNDYNRDVAAQALRNNDIFLPTNSFTKVYNQPLFLGPTPPEQEGLAPIIKPESSFSVSLNIEIIDDEDMINLDVIKNTANKTDVHAYKDKPRADNPFNSLCSWELILDIGARDFKETDSLGSIAYGEHPRIPGYNFITTDPGIVNKLPISVLNAPNQNINDFSTCYYNKEIDKDLSPLKTPNELRFPTAQILMGLSLTAAVGAAGSLLGVVVSFQAIKSAFASITQFLGGLIRRRVQDQLQTVFEKSLYTQRSYGGKDKILLHVGSNNPVVYDLEASIYKYKNTPILRKKVRKYIKPNDQFYPDLGKFKIVKSVVSIKDLFDYLEFDDTSGLSRETYKINKLTYTSLKPQGLRINSTTVIKEDDIVLYDDELWVAHGDKAWDVLDSTNVPFSQLAKNNMAGLLFLSNVEYPTIRAGTEPTKEGEKIVKDAIKYDIALIEGTRAYNYFDINRLVSCTNGNRYHIKGKGKIIKDNIEYTAIQFAFFGEPPEGSEIFLRPEDNPNILVWSDRESDHFDTNQTPINVKSNIFPKGTYGIGTPMIESSYLSDQSVQNDTRTIFDIFNNQESNLKPHNKVHVYPYNENLIYGAMVAYSGISPNYSETLGVVDIGDINEPKRHGVLQGLPSSSRPLTAGYAYNIHDLLKKQEEQKRSEYIHIKYENDNSDINFETWTENFYNNPDSTKGNILELKNQTFKSLDENYGYVVVDGDYELSYATSLKTFKGITYTKSGSAPLSHGETVSAILRRLAYLDNIYPGDAVSDQGFERMTIPELESTLDGLQEDKPECFSAQYYGSVSNSCVKTFARRCLSALYAEKNVLMELLEKIGIVYNNSYRIIYDPNFANSVIVPHKEITLFTTGDGSSSYPFSITDEKDREDIYWINIDTEQECKTSRDASIKILSKAKYVCWPSTAVVAGDLGVIPSIDNTVQNFCPSESDNAQGDGVEFFREGANVFTYVMSDDFVLSEMARYQQIYGIDPEDWEEMVFPGRASIGGFETVTRSFFVRPDRHTADIFVEVTETYFVPSEIYFAKFIGRKDIADYLTAVKANNQNQAGNPGAVQNPLPDKPDIPYGQAYGEYTGKVRKIIPSGVIDNINQNNLICRSKVIPRKLKRTDTHYDRYKVDFNGNLIEALPSQGPGGPYTSNLEFWHCWYQTGDRLQFNPILPTYIKLTNEMIYRCYFGSYDNAEHNSPYEDSKEAFEWIPYEYDPQWPPPVI